MKVVCAWCGKNMGEKPPIEDTDVTHDMCLDCYQKELSKINRRRIKTCQRKVSRQH